MPAPSVQPRWADVGGQITEPTSGKKDKGFKQKEKPPAQYLNWLFNLIYQWIAYFATLIAQPVVRNRNALDCTITVNGAAANLANTSPTNYNVNGDGSFATDIYWAITPAVGETITEVHYRRVGDGTHAIWLDLFRENGDGTATNLAHWHEDNTDSFTPSAVWATAGVTLGTPEVVVANKTYIIRAVLIAGGVSCKVSSLGYTSTPVA